MTSISTSRGATASRSSIQTPFSTTFPVNRNLSSSSRSQHVNVNRISNDHSTPRIPVSPLMCLLPRQGRQQRNKAVDLQPATSFGDPITQKQPQSTRILFQNVKGLSSSAGKEDYRYYFDCLQALQVDVAGLSETNTCWQHVHLRDDFLSVARRYYRQSKVVFGSASTSCDPIPINESFQSGGNVTFLHGGLVSRISGPDIHDTSGLGRWNGVTIAGKQDQYLTILTAYRVCSGSIRSSPLGSAFSREHNFFTSTTKQPTVNPRRLFLRDLQIVISSLQEKGHSVVLMMDANATESSDSHFSDFIAACSFSDLHAYDPAPSTYIGSETRRIDYILGCPLVQQQMLRSGTLSYYEGPQSDHRSLYVDLDLTYLQVPVEKIPSGIKRALHTGNPELVEAYNASLLRYYSDHNMFERINSLYANYTTMTKAAIRDALTRWDNDQGRAMEMSEHKLSKPSKKCKWSPILRNLAKTRLYWKLRLRECKQSADYSATFQRWQRQIQVHDPTFVFPFMMETLSESEIRREFNQATVAFRRCQQQDAPMRMKTYEELLVKYEDDTNPATKTESRRKATIIRNTIDSEVIRTKFRDIRNVIKPSTNASISKVLIPRIPGSASTIPSDQIYQMLQETDPTDMIWDTIVDREQIEKHLLDYNSASFRAASESPCGHGLIYDSLTFSSLSPIAIRLLEGETPEEWHKDDAVLKEFLASFTIPDVVKQKGDIPSLITEEDVKYGFRKWRETTSTSPSGRHLGHYRSFIQHPSLLTCFVKFMNIAVQSGTSIPRWSNAVNVLIEKDLGKPKINRLRIIHLFEADLNFYLKLQWGHRLVRRAVDCDLLHDGQHGSTPGRTSLDPIMLTQFTSDLCRVLKHDFARFDNDASACYDRIIIALAMLAARRCGMPINAVRVHSEALSFMRYTVKTIYGVSESNYQGTTFAPLFGTGQGSGASPAAWLSLVVLLLQTLDKIVPDRINFSSPTGNIQHSRLSDAFVDDTYLGFTSYSDTASYESLVRRLEDIAQKWEHLLFLSGGKLNLSKCSWYVLRWEWESGRPLLRRIQPHDSELKLRQGYSPETATIRRTEYDQSHRMLGVILNPLGDFGEHLRFLKKKADTFAQRLMSPRLTSHDVRIFHRSTYIPSMRYGLAAVAIDEEALGQVQSKVVKSILQKMHVQSTIPTAIRHGPAEFGGLDIYDLRTEAGIEAIKFLRDALYSQSETGKLIRLNLYYSQIEAGVGERLLEHPELHLSYLTPTWITSVRHFLYCHNMSMTVTDDYAISLQGPTDQYIMQSKHLGRYSASQQRDINLVRLYLQVHTLADMSDSTKKNAMDLNYLDATRPSNFNPNSAWPRQSQPTKAQIRLWKRYIRSSYLRYVPYWVTNPTKTHDLHKKVESLTPAVHFDTLPEYLNTLPKQHQRLLDGFEQIATDVQVWKAFRSRRRLHFATDGGLSSQQGTQGWVLSTETKILFQGAGPVDGPYELATSTRSELAGYASSLLLIRALTKFWGLPHRSKFKWYCDSRAAISRVRKYASRLSSPARMPNDSDLISIIRSCHRDLRHSVSAQWVKGHQDTIAKGRTLSLASRLNIRADKLATMYRLNGRLSPLRLSQHEEGQHCSIQLNGSRLTGQFDASIRFHINGYHLRRHLQEKTQWNDKVWDDIDFYIFGGHFRRLAPHRQSTWMKFVHEQLPIGERRYKQASVKDESQRLCPCCKKATESMSHLWSCTANTCHADSMKTLQSALCSTESHPVGHLLYSGISNHVAHPEVRFDPRLDDYPPQIRPYIMEALVSQEAIGWHHAMKGFLSKKWRVLAGMAMFDCGSKDDDLGISRMKKFIGGLHDHSIRIWTSRNDTLHSKDDASLAQIRSAEMAEITYLHSQTLSLCSADRYLCSRSLPQLLSSAPSTRRRWLRRVKLSREQHLKDGARQALITNYFPTATVT